MTDVANGMSQGIDTSSSQGSNSSSQAAPQVQPGVEERSFRQSEVNEIVKRAKNDAVETYKRITNEQPQYALQKYGEGSQQPPQSGNQVNEETYRRIASEEAKRHLESVQQDALRQNQDEMAKRTVQTFFAKTHKGKEKYQDFDQVTGDVDLGRFPNVVRLLADFVDNSEDMFYELGKDRIKMANLEHLANLSPNDAIVQARRLSQSIKDNQASAKVRFPNEPLSQMRPSHTGTDSGAKSVGDYRKKYRG